ncbi:MarR family winged helix-turn-helix transcriptional regulator [Hyphomonas sp.]|uniref:MarR family winged helix-turn-helix transcriptional regulator n=1 Tax=Hyphomonas sp. TaxID=87 RepID=UPI00391CC0A5
MIDSRKQNGLTGSVAAPIDQTGPKLGDDELKDILEDIAMMNSVDQKQGDPVRDPASTTALIDALAGFSHRLFQAHSAFVEARIGGTDITLRQFVLLSALSKLKSATQRELTDTIGMDRSTLSDVIRRLSSNGLILQKQSKDDARAKVVSLTDRGRETLARMSPIISQANREFFGLLSEVEMKSLAGIQARLLRRDDPYTVVTETAPSASARNGNAERQSADNTTSLNRLQRARIAFEADLITKAEFETEKRRYLEGDPD